MASEVQDEYEEPMAEELLLVTERLDDDGTTQSLLRVDLGAEREKPRYTNILTSDDEVCEEEEDADRSESPHQGWTTARSDSATLIAESAQHTQQSSRPPLQPNDPHRRRKLVNGKDQQQVQSLTRKLSQYKKLNAELHHQLQVFYKNEAVAQASCMLSYVAALFASLLLHLGYQLTVNASMAIAYAVVQLENKNKEKQLQINQLLHENRILSHQQRLLAKQIEELQDSKDNLPLKKYALQEELRICKEKLRQHKEEQKKVDEKSFKMHQQAVDLATKNKALIERVKKLETVTALSPPASSACLPTAPASYVAANGGSSSALLDTESIIASQEAEITRLQQRVALMKKTQRAEKAKQERLLKANHEELEQARTQLDAFYQQLFTKEKTIRSLFLQMKKLKRAVQDLSNAQQTNQQMQQMVFGREVRFPNHSSTHTHSHLNQQQHHRSSVSHHQVGHMSHTTTSSSPTHSVPFAASKKVAANRIHDTLKQLGYIPSFTASGKHLEMPKRGLRESLTETDGAGNAEEEEKDEDELPPNLVQGKLIPMPPPSSVSRNVVRNGTLTSRNQFYSPPSREDSRREMLETALDIERDDGDPGQDDDNDREVTLDDFATRGFIESDSEEEDDDEEREEAVSHGGEEHEAILQQSRSGKDEQDAVADDELA